MSGKSTRAAKPWKRPVLRSKSQSNSFKSSVNGALGETPEMSSRKDASIEKDGVDMTDDEEEASSLGEEDLVRVDDSDHDEFRSPKKART